MNLLSRCPPPPWAPRWPPQALPQPHLVEHSPQLLRQLWRSPPQEQDPQDEVLAILVIWPASVGWLLLSEWLRRPLASHRVSHQGSEPKKLLSCEEVWQGSASTQSTRQHPPSLSRPHKKYLPEVGCLGTADAVPEEAGWLELYPWATADRTPAAPTPVAALPFPPFLSPTGRRGEARHSPQLWWAAGAFPSAGGTITSAASPQLLRLPLCLQPFESQPWFNMIFQLPSEYSVNEWWQGAIHHWALGPYLSLQHV